MWYWVGVKSCMISCMILFMKWMRFIYDVMHGIMNIMVSYRISYMMSYVFMLISYKISFIISNKILYCHVWYHNDPFLGYSDIVKKLWYNVVIMISCMISSFWQYHSHLPVSCAIFYDFAYDIICISYKICYDIRILWYDSWHQSI